MKKRFLFSIFVLIAVILICLGIKVFSKEKMYTLEELNISLRNVLKVEFLDKVKVSEFITLKEGSLVDDYEIKTNELGKKEVVFTIAKNKKKYKSSFEIEIVDTTEPIIWLKSSYSVTKGNNIDLTKKVLCGDNYDDKPKCEVIGNYDINIVGKYDLVFKATDNSGNTKEQPFTLNVKEPVAKSNQSSNTNSSTNSGSKTLFSDVVAKHKNANTQIGIDISKWQGDVDFEKLKNAGVEFVIIRVGSAEGIGKKRFVDSKFVQNITRANKVGIPVGIYYYSYADSSERAIEDAKWIIEQIKDYKVDLPIAFDWENWSNYNAYNLSFYHLTKMAEDYLDVFESAGYKGMLYSSKTYLENIWLDTKYDVWLAHYVTNTNYIGKYSYWQMCSNGRVDGINGDVDINIRYLD